VQQVRWGRRLGGGKYRRPLLRSSDRGLGTSPMAAKPDTSLKAAAAGAESWIQER
jgi:hypothetical protein